MKEKELIIEVFSGTLWEASMIQSLLENAEIKSFQRNAIGTAYGFNPTSSGDVKLMISIQDLPIAAKIIEEYRFNQKVKSRD